MGQYFDNIDLDSKIIKYETKIFNSKYSFYTDNGVFSKTKLDYGTRFLIESLPLNEMHGDILDIGCGYGAIGIILGKKVDANFDGIDVNLRAISLAKENSKLNSVKNTNFFISNCYENINKQYNYIITNPPIRAGKEVVYNIVMNARNHLKENGQLYIVVRKQQGAKSMIKDLEAFYKVEILGKSKGFFVIRCCLR